MAVSFKYPLIGIAGTFASGKDTVAHRLEEKFGYHHVSLGDIIREVAMEERGSIERPVLFEVATEHRYRDGAGAFANIALEKPRPLVVTGVRTLGEARAIKDGGGIILFTDAPIEVRYARMQSRARDAEAKLTLQAFKQNEQKEWYAGSSDADFNLRDVKEMSDIVIENALELEPFLQDVYRHLELQ